MDSIDLKKNLKSLFTAPAGEFVHVDVPDLPFLKVDGSGDPNVTPEYRDAVEWLYSMAYTLKFWAKAALNKNFVVPPLEGLWHADDPSSFVERRKSEWKWTMMIMLPDFIEDEPFDVAMAKTRVKRGDPPPSLRLERLHEGPSLQALHVGAYDDEGPLLARLHHQIMPERGVTFAGPHHEIYLSDPRRVEPARLKTILRQPVKPLS